MGDRGAALIEALIVLAIVAVTGTVAMRVVAELPPRAREWDEASADRQILRVIESRVARLAAASSPVVVDVDGATVRVPGIWPRRLGLVRPDAAHIVSTDAVTFLTRGDAHRVLVLTSAAAAVGGSVSFSITRGCGTEAACGVRAGDLLLAVDRGGAAGLFRVASAGPRLDLEPVSSGASSFPPGSVLVPVSIDTIAFEADESALRRYDGYRSDNVLVDSVASAAFTVAAAAALGDGPFVGSGAMAYDVDQLTIRGMALDVRLTERASRLPASVARFVWSVRPWR
jgi:type II secretory pathway pseudopilin PulG